MPNFCDQWAFLCMYAWFEALQELRASLRFNIVTDWIYGKHHSFHLSEIYLNLFDIRW